MNPIPNISAQNVQNQTVQNAAPSPIEQGYAFFKKGDLKVAKERFASVADDPSLHNQAMEGVQRVIEQVPHTSDNEVLFFECLELLKNFRFEYYWFEKVLLPFFVQHPDAKNRLAKIAARKEQLFFQIKIMAHKMGGEHFKKNLLMAKTYAEEAISELSNVDFVWHHWLGDILVALSRTTPNPAAQRGYLVAAIAKYELYHESHKTLVKAKTMLSMHDQEALFFQDYFPSVITRIVFAYTSATYTQCLAPYQTDFDAVVDYGVAVMMEGCFTRAIEQFNKVVDRTQADSLVGIRARRNLEQVQKLMADPTSAFDFLNQCIQVHYSDSLAQSNDADASFMNCVFAALDNRWLSEERRKQIDDCEWVIDHVLLHFFAEDTVENRKRIQNRLATLQRLSKEKDCLECVLLFILWKGTNVIPKDLSRAIQLAEKIHARGGYMLTGFILGDLYFEQYQQEKTEANFKRAKERLERNAGHIKRKAMSFSKKLSSFGFKLSEVFSQLTELYTAENNSAKVEECTQLRLQQLKIDEWIKCRDAANKKSKKVEHVI